MGVLIYPMPVAPYQMAITYLTLNADFSKEGYRRQQATKNTGVKKGDVAVTLTLSHINRKFINFPSFPR